MIPKTTATTASINIPLYVPPPTPPTHSPTDEQWDGMVKRLYGSCEKRIEQIKEEDAKDLNKVEDNGNNS